jgi:predicted GNAT family N-acyltransferase
LGNGSCQRTRDCARSEEGGPRAERGDIEAMEVGVYAGAALPDELQEQMLALLRDEWAADTDGGVRPHNWIHRPQHHPTHFVLVEDGVLISHVGVLWTELEHEEASYLTYGLGEVLTRPSCRGRGHGSQLVAAATAFIRESNADIGLFTCAPRNVAFYAAQGWIPMTEAILFGGPRSAPHLSAEVAMMGFFSARGQAARTAFAAQPIFFDDDLW